MEAHQAQRILVPVNGQVPELDDETVRLACRLAPTEGARIYAVHVIEVTRSRPIDTFLPEDHERGEQVLNRAEELISGFKLEAETELVQARDSGPAIVGEADEWKAELIVMGLPYKRRFGDFFLGKTAPYVLKHASCQVILFRERLQT